MHVEDVGIVIMSASHPPVKNPGSAPESVMFIHRYYIGCVTQSMQHDYFHKDHDLVQ